ncbi:hypothetical protein R5W24_005859 [Gemmata sp. JC717]|uniref:hypothetical protein n=1 Tax=Gemmata algarum TaxID=2975278 RepID=UPI0021BB1E46|nr:hypothetical protein [Gemmata algarum]MDY3556689.1 hypothetical protein [Gemmata algarum]
MGSLKGALAAAVNWAARPLGVTVVPTWQWTELSSGSIRAFTAGGAEVPFFYHHHNCGGHAATATERTIELALADRWLDHVPEDKLVEVGAVTPYYWPGRVRRVVDPTDPHPRVTERASILDLDMSGAAVLCMSTLEHVGSGEYGLPPDPAALRRAVDKLFAEAAAFLVTIPVGYTPYADAVLFDHPTPPDVNVHRFARSAVSPYWHEVGAGAARVPYGPDASPVPGARGANAVVAWVRGGSLEPRACG